MHQTITQLRISGTPNALNMFFIATRWWQNHNGPSREPCVLYSFPRDGGYVVGLNPKIESCKLIVETIAAAASATATTYADECLDAVELVKCKEFLRFILCAVEKGHLTCTGMDVNRLQQLCK